MNTRPRHIRIAPALCSVLLFALPVLSCGQTPQKTGRRASDSGTAGPEQLVQQRVEQAEHYISRGNYTAALSEIHDALTIAPDHPLLLQLAAHIYGARGAYILAEDCWSRLREKDPDNELYQTGLAGMHIRQGSMRPALPLLNAVLRRNPASLPARYNLALFRMTEGKTNEAYKALCARTSSETGQLASWIAEEREVITRLLGRRGFHELARMVLGSRSPGKGADRDARVVEKLRLVADHTFQSFEAAEEENWNGAIAALNQAMQAGAAVPSIQQDVAIYAWRNGNREKARTLLLALTRRFPDQPSIPAELGILCLQEGLDAEAVNHLKAAVLDDPINAQAMLALACAYAKSEETIKARYTLERLQRLLNKHPGLAIDTEQDYAGILRENVKLKSFIEKIEELK